MVIQNRIPDHPDPAAIRVGRPRGLARPMAAGKPAEVIASDESDTILTTRLP
jgi:hypothetical protein